jgi:hypothetical protein
LQPQLAMHVRGSLAPPCTIYYNIANSVDEMPDQSFDVRSEPISPHDSALEQIQREASAEPSSSNLDVTTSQDQDITSSDTLSSQESLKRKIPDDGFDEDNVRIFSALKSLRPI